MHAYLGIHRTTSIPLRTVTLSHSARTSSHRVGWALHRPRGIPGSTPIRWERARQLWSAQARLRCRPRHRHRRRRGARRRRRRERTAAPRGETRGGIRGAALPCRTVLTRIRTHCENWLYTRTNLLRAPSVLVYQRRRAHLAFGLHTHTVGIPRPSAVPYVYPRTPRGTTQRCGAAGETRRATTRSSRSTRTFSTCRCCLKKATRRLQHLLRILRRRCRR